MLSFTSEGIDPYVVKHTTPHDHVFEALAKHTAAHTEAPEMQVGHVEGAFLKLLVRTTAARRVLEIGTFTGYSALAMADGLPSDGELITCDIDRHATAIAEQFWAQHPAGNKITLKLGRALDTIKTLDGSFDIVFIDADKAGYIDYWEACVPLVRSGGLLLVDNVLWSGRVINPIDTDDRAIDAFNAHAAKDERVDLVMLTIRDGIVMACKH